MDRRRVPIQRSESVRAHFRWLRTLIETLNDRAIDGKSRATEGRAAWPGNQTVLHKGEDLELFPELSAETAVNRILRPCIQLGIPCRAIIESDRRDTTKNIVGPEAIRQVRGQSLAKWVAAGAGFRSVGRNKDALDGTREAIVVT